MASPVLPWECEFTAFFVRFSMLTFLYRIVQSLACLVGGSIIGLIYNWRVALVGIGMSTFFLFDIEPDSSAC